MIGIVKNKGYSPASNNIFAILPIYFYRCFTALPIQRARLNFDPVLAACLDVISPKSTYKFANGFIISFSAHVFTRGINAQRHIVILHQNVQNLFFWKGASCHFSGKYETNNIERYLMHDVSIHLWRSSGCCLRLLGTTPSPSFPLPEGEGGEPRRAARALLMIECGRRRGLRT